MFIHKLLLGWSNQGGREARIEERNA